MNSSQNVTRESHFDVKIQRAKQHAVEKTFNEQSEKAFALIP